LLDIDHSGRLTRERNVAFFEHKFPGKTIERPEIQDATQVPFCDYPDSDETNEITTTEDHNVNNQEAECKREMIKLKSQERNPEEDSQPKKQQRRYPLCERKTKVFTDHVISD
jgi:hypothetical protein